MSKCALCGKGQTARCEAGVVSYIAGDYPCFQNPEPFAPRLAAPVEIDEWSVPALPSTAGLEDML